METDKYQRSELNMYLMSMIFITFVTLYSYYSVQYNSLKRQYNTSIRVLGSETVLQAQSGMNQVDFLYDASGARILKNDTSGDKTYYISPELEVIVSPDGTTKWRRYYYFAGKLVAVREGP